MFKQLINGFHAAPQLTELDFAQAAAKGFKTVINNRPDGEEPFQLSDAGARAAARANGLAYHYLPVINGHLTNETVDAMRALMAECEQPVVAYCRSGTRSTFLWAFASAGSLPADDIVQAAADAGYDLSGVKDQLEALGKR